MRRLRRTRLLLAIAFCVTAGVASASAFIPQPGTESAGGPDALQPDGTPATIGATAADPQGGPDWAVRVYRSRTGATCPEAGRLSSDGRFGRFDGDRFSPLPVEAAGSCGDLGEGPATFAVNRYPAQPERGARIAIFGVAAPQIEAVTLRDAGSDHALALDGRDHSFLAVRSGSALDDLSLAFRTRAGDTTSYALAPREGG